MPVSPRISVEPHRPTLDTPLRIQITGLPPGDQVTVRGTLPDQRGHLYVSRAELTADADGTVDLSRDASTAGSYTGVDPMGLIWSAKHQGPGGRPGAGVLPPQPLTVTVTMGGQQVAEATVERLRTLDGVRREEVRAGGVVGTLFLPAGDAARPAVIVIGGSEGGAHDLDAALLAGHGFAALALAYFGAPGRPDGLVDIPLEYFGTAIEFLTGHPSVDSDRIGLIGASRGGEAVLLVAATFPQVGPVVSVVGSGLITQGIPRHPSLLSILRDVQPSWTWEGKPLPFLPYTIADDLRERVESNTPVDLRAAFRPDLADRTTIEEATIPVERARGPFLFLTTGDDRSWPCRELSQVAMDRLDPSAYQHVHYPRAGHPIAPPPFGPATALQMPGPGVTFNAGGTVEANAQARADSWRRSVAFFTESWQGARS